MAFQAKFHNTFLPLAKAEKDNAVLGPKLLEAWNKLKQADPQAAAADKRIAP